jgi:hypothetical protein
VSPHPARGTGDRLAPGKLTAQVRARSILLSTHQLLISELAGGVPGGASGGVPGRVSGGMPPQPGSASVLYGFVCVGAVPYLVSLDGDDLHPGPVLAVATGVADQLGALRLTGELGEWIYPSADRRVAEALEEHLDCMDATARDLMQVVRVRVAPVRAGAVWLLAPGEPEWELVELGEFEAAQADLWTAFGPEVIRHLHEHHHDALLELARGSGVFDCTAVSIASLGADGAVLTAMNHSGVMDVVVPFVPPVTAPGEAAGRLTGVH